MTNTQIFPLRRKPLQTQQLKLLQQRDPVLYNTVQSSDILVEFLVNISVKYAINIFNASTQLDIKDDTDALNAALRELRVGFPKILCVLKQRIRDTSIEAAKLGLNHKEDGVCAVCQYEQCTRQMGCCQSPIHESCYMEYRIAGFEKCPYCRMKITI